MRKEKFKARYRLTKNQVNNLLYKLKKFLQHYTMRGSPLPRLLQILIALRFYCQVSIQLVTADLHTLLTYITPLFKPSNSKDNAHNKSHIKTRNLIERLFGSWKRRFSCLSNGLNVNILSLKNVITACGVLWNLIRETEKIVFDEIKNEIDSSDSFISDNEDTTD